MGTDLGIGLWSGSCVLWECVSDHHLPLVLRRRAGRPQSAGQAGGALG